MITPVSDDDLEKLRTAEDRDACTGGTQDRIDAVIAELRTLRVVADAAVKFVGTPYWEYGDELRAALRDAGRLP